MSEKIPLPKALLLIFLSTLFISGFGIGGWSWWRIEQKRRPHNERYLMRRLLTHAEGVALPDSYFLDLLPFKEPVNLYALDLCAIEERLYISPYIAKAEVMRRRPDCLVIDYAVRTPIARVEGGNLIDLEGKLFPDAPIFNSEVLPELFLGTSHELVVDLLSVLNEFNMEPLRIDLRRADAESFGQQQITIDMGENTLILSPYSYREALCNYKKLDAKLASTGEVIDLRIPGLGFISEETTCQR